MRSVVTVLMMVTLFGCVLGVIFCGIVTIVSVFTGEWMQAGMFSLLTILFLLADRLWEWWLSKLRHK